MIVVDRSHMHMMALVSGAPAGPPQSKRTAIPKLIRPHFLIQVGVLKAGSLVEAHAVAAAFGLILVFLGIKMATKFIGILPLTVYHEFDSREGMYTTILMSTGLTFGSISALFGLTNRIINQGQYPSDGRHRQRGGADAHCTKRGSAAIQGDLVRCCRG